MASLNNVFNKFGGAMTASYELSKLREVKAFFANLRYSNFREGCQNFATFKSLPVFGGAENIPVLRDELSQLSGFCYGIANERQALSVLNLLFIMEESTQENVRFFCVCTLVFYI